MPKNNQNLWVSKYVLLIKLALPFSFFSVGILWERNNISHNYLFLFALILLFLFALLHILTYYYHGILRKQFIFMEDQINALKNVSEIRIRNWKDIADIFARQDISTDDKLVNIFESGLLDAKESIEAVTKKIGEVFLREVVSGKFGIPHEMRLGIFYIQKDPEKDRLVIKHNGFYSDKLGIKIHRDRRAGKRVFYKNDQTTAGTVWGVGKPIFIEDTNDELKKADGKRAFTIFEGHENTRSICCLPVKQDNLFFGVLCIKSNMPYIIQENYTFQTKLIKSFEPIINQLKLIELVKHVKNSYIKERLKG